MESYVPQRPKGAEDSTLSPATHIPPFDFGEGRKAIMRALELNRLLLYEPNVVLDLEDAIDRGAVRAKINALLDRLLDTPR